MTRICLIIVTFISATNAVSQPANFETALSNLFFGVRVIEAGDGLVDTLMTVPSLHPNDTLVTESSLSLNMRLGTGKDGWCDRYRFTFTESPLPGLKIKSGYIEISIGHADRLKKLLDVNWSVQFGNRTDANRYYARIQKIFIPISAKHRSDYVKDLGRLDSYSVPEPIGNEFRVIRFSLHNSIRRKEHEIVLSLSN